MTIEIGQTLPTQSLYIATNNGPQAVVTSELFANKNSILFGVPAAFSPTCTAHHLPGFVKDKKKLEELGIHQIVCVSVNDAFVMLAWAKSLGIEDEIIMLCDGNGTFSSELGLSIDLAAHGLGIRSKRYSMIIDDGIVKKLEIEDSPATCSVSSSEFMVNFLSK
jgi:peroxiredoxin